MEKTNNINLLIVDDHKLFLQGISSLLSNIPRFNIVGTASSAFEALNLISSLDVDLVLTDLSMPGISGIDLIDRIKKQHPKKKVIAITTHSETNIISSALRNGVDGYLLKNVGQEELVKAIDEVMLGNQYISEQVKNAVMQQMTTTKRTSAQILPDLTEREIEVLNLISQEYTQEEISEKLFISPSTVVFHRRKLLLKLEVKNTAGLIKRAMNLGLIK